VRIAVIGKKNHLFWDTHVKEALKELGHEVLHFQINVRPLSVNIVRNIAKPFGKKYISDRMHAATLKKLLKRFRPDLAFFTSAFFIPPVYYETVRELKIPVFAWDGDGGPCDDSNARYRPFIDILFESELRYVEENRLEFKQMEYLPFGVNPRLFKSLGLQRNSTIFFAGAATPKRVALLQKIDYPMKIRGWGWEGLRKPMFDIKNEKLGIQEIIHEYNTTWIALNIHQELNSHIDALNMRTFEVPACGAALLCDYRKELELHFDLDNEIIVYDEKNIAEKIDRLRDKRYVQKIAHKGLQRVLANHTYRHRMQTVLNLI